MIPRGIDRRRRLALASWFAARALNLFWIGGRFNGLGRNVQAFAERISPPKLIHTPVERFRHGGAI